MHLHFYKRKTQNAIAVNVSVFPVVLHALIELASKRHLFYAKPIV